MRKSNFEKDHNEIIENQSEKNNLNEILDYIDEILKRVDQIQDEDKVEYHIVAKGGATCQ